MKLSKSPDHDYSTEMLAAPSLSISIVGGSPYGFKMQGGKEYMTPLSVLSVCYHSFRTSNILEIVLVTVLITKHIIRALV